MFHRNLTGLDLHEPTNVLVENQTGSDLSTLKVVKLDGFGTQRPKVSICDGSVDKAFGVVANPILNGTLGYVTSFGFLYNVNTVGFTENQPIYCDNSGNLTATINGTMIAVVIKVHATTGILFVLSISSYIDPETNAWSVSGNSGTDLTNFLGTRDAKPLRIRTNNNQVAQFDVNGRLAIGAHDPASPLHIKSYPGYSGSGYRVDTFALTSNSTSFVPSYSITMSNGQVMKVKYQVTCRQSDGSQRASFTRSAVFYKEGGNVMIQDTTWSSDFTSKSSPAFEVSYTLGVTDITFNVKNSSTTDTYWSGHVEMELIAGAI